MLVGGRIGRASTSCQTRRLQLPAHALGPVTLIGEIHLVTSVIFDIGVYLVVIGVMLDLARSLGAGIDQHEEEDRAPSPQTASPRVPGRGPEGGGAHEPEPRP